MLSIKLQRIGKKHQPSYRLVVAEARSKMAAPPVEDLGSYQPRTKAAAFKRERVSYWLGVGAQPTVSVHNLLVAQGIVTGAKFAVKMAKPVAAPVAEAPAAESPSATPEAVAPAAEAPAQPIAEIPAEETPAA
jgi:small subunit ribosomal protein S16